MELARRRLHDSSVWIPSGCLALARPRAVRSGRGCWGAIQPCASAAIAPICSKVNARDHSHHRLAAIRHVANRRDNASRTRSRRSRSPARYIRLRSASFMARKLGARHGPSGSGFSGREPHVRSTIPIERSRQPMRSENRIPGHVHPYRSCPRSSTVRHSWTSRSSRPSRKTGSSRREAGTSDPTTRER